ncbi:hypothetical protein [Pseudomonas glycinae]|uniref:hypothetical protein n=1 Tax=Pseudomonas glycinae TaxID=1785145 RepID=UPI001F1BB24B|nr:hypothetical protein [Pseudomonas glycinae]
MITKLLTNSLSPSELLQKIRTCNMRAEVEKLVKTINNKNKTPEHILYKTRILNITNLHNNNLTLYCNDIGNISIKIPDNNAASPYMYSIPGKTFLFSIDGHSFDVQHYQIDDNGLKHIGSVTINEGSPLYIDGTKELYECAPDIAFGAMTLVDRRADISVYDRQTLQKVAWLPNDQSAARFLVALELLEVAQDPQRRKVAEELVYHSHAAVAWNAFNVIAEQDRQAALAYAPVMRLLRNDKLNSFLDYQQECAQ